MPRVRLRRVVTTLVALCATGACGLPARQRSAPLVGRIWQVEPGRFTSEEALLGDLAGQRYVLLGEVHDNPEHHRIEARVLDGLAARGRRPAVVLEMIARDHADALEQVLREPGVDAEQVRRAVAWDASGWPAWPLYAPVFEAALRDHLPLAAGDLSRADRDALRREGAKGLPADTIARLDLAAPLPEPQREVLADAIREGHCRLLPEEAIPAMVGFQRARDAQLARSLVDAATRDGAVLVAGAGHVRRDVAVPYWLARFAPGAGVATVALVEVEPDDIDPAHVLEEEYGARVPFDYLWFTRPAEREDPCEQLRRRTAPGAPAPATSPPAPDA